MPRLYHTMAQTFQLEIVTPERLLVSDVAEEMQIPGKNGYLGILPQHAPLITELGVGEISYRKGLETRHLAVAWGFAEVLPDKVTILAETAEKAEEIDVERARQAKQRAEAQLKQAHDTDYLRAELALERAITRLQVAEKK
jgi:F-type H+-transporting ATPase subunit epsilon